MFLNFPDRFVFKNYTDLLTDPYETCTNGMETLSKLGARGNTVFVLNITSETHGTINLADKTRSAISAKLDEGGCPGGISSTLTNEIKESYYKLRAARGWKRTDGVYRVSLYFRWGDVGKGASLKNISSYDVRTGNCSFFDLLRQGNALQRIISGAPESNPIFQTSRNKLSAKPAVSVFSEGNQTEFESAVRTILPEAEIFIGGPWQKALDQLSLSDVIIAGHAQESFVRLAAGLCEDCWLLDCSNLRNTLVDLRHNLSWPIDAHLSE